MAAALNLDTMQYVARIMRDSYLSHAVLLLFLVGFVKCVVAVWR